MRRSRWYESVLLLLVTFTLLRPDFWVDRVWDKYRVEPATNLIKIAQTAAPDASLRVRIDGTSLEGKDVKKPPCYHSVMTATGSSASKKQA